MELVSNKKAKSPVWRHFGFVKEIGGDQNRPKRVGCRLCDAILKFSGNTTNLTDHLRRKHPNALVALSSSKDVAITTTTTTEVTQPSLASGHFGQLSISGFFGGKKLNPSGNRSKNITDSMLRFIIKDLRPFSVVENAGFRHMLHTLEPNYTIPSRQLFSDKLLPELYETVKSDVKKDLSSATSVALTTDGWTSRATESYVTITSSHISSDWQLKSYVLQTRAMAESHTGVNIGNVLTEAIAEWKMPPNPPIVTDNAANMLVAAQECGLSLHIGCFAHTLNLACSKSLKINQVSRLLGRIRRIVSYFHRSSIATAILKEKQQLLLLPSHKLILDVQTRWNSAVDMMSRYLEQQPAIYAALTAKELRGKDKDIQHVSENDIAAAEDLLAVLGPLKTATVALCEETVPTLSIVLPLHTQLITSIMIHEDTDSELVKSVKQAVKQDLGKRYTDKRAELTLATLLDPRFKQLPFLSSDERRESYRNLTEQAIKCSEAHECRVSALKAIKVEKVDAGNPVDPVIRLPELPTDFSDITDVTVTEPTEPKKIKLESDCAVGKKTAMSSLFGDVYIVKVDQPDPIEERAECEVKEYKQMNPIPTGENPLNWWRTNSDRLPILSLLARKYLCIPATSVPSERVFSTAGDIVTAQRSSLKSKHVDQLIFLKKNWNP